MQEQLEAAVCRLQEKHTMENLWECIVLFQNYQFYTMTGLPFHYTIRLGQDGTMTKELWIDRRSGSKSLVYSSIERAFHNACQLQGQIIERPKALGDIRGISYIYPMFAEFGLIRVPETVRERMRISQ